MFTLNHLPRDLVADILCLTTPKSAPTAAARVFHEAITAHRLVVLVWFQHVAEPISWRLARRTKATDSPGTLVLLWPSTMAKCATAAIDAAHARCAAGVGFALPPMDIGLFHSLLGSLLWRNGGFITAARQHHLLDSLTKPVLLGNGLHGFVPDGLVLALYFEALGENAQLDAALSVMARNTPVLAFEPRVPLQRLLELVPDRTPAFETELGSLRSALRLHERDTRNGSVLADFFSLVAVSAALHWNLDGLQAVAKHHPQFDRVVALLSSPLVYGAFLPLLNQHPIARVVEVLEWLFAHGWSMQTAAGESVSHAGSTPHPFVTGYVDGWSPSATAVAALLLFYKFDYAHVDASAWSESTKRAVATALIPWIKRGDTDVAMEIAIAWPWLLEIPHWATVVAATCYAGHPADEIKLMVSLVSEDAWRPLMRALMRQFVGPFFSFIGPLTRIISLVTEREGDAAMAAVLTPFVPQIADDCFARSLDALGLGSPAVRFEIAEALMKKATPEREPLVTEALGELLISFLAHGGDGGVDKIVQLAGDDADNWIRMYASIIGTTTHAFRLILYKNGLQHKSLFESSVASDTRVCARPG
ncbi:hypothetical protein H9P43_009610 [Blastocladiella emersonii ATCC 22665]|nr:hypothetical protein H9P43_009610 [Blastocladiella emersonii ATCC 22665]